MTSGEFTVADLRRILYAAAGESDSGDVDGDALDTDFGALGYESLALLEAGSWIEREYGIELSDSALFDSATPRALIVAVNEQLAVSDVPAS